MLSLHPLHGSNPENKVKFRLAWLLMLLFTTATLPSIATDPATDRAFRAHRFAKHYMYGTLTAQAAEQIKKG